MFNTIKNFSRKSEKYGDVHLISFLGAVLSRLAYVNDNNFLTRYVSIMGPIFHPKILQSINNVKHDNLDLLLDDQTLFGLNKDDNDVFKNHEYEYKGKNYIDFIALDMPRNVNIVNGELSAKRKYPLEGQATPIDAVKYISIGWSNYGEIYIVADKRMANTLFVIFRGTYSAKTAALYSKPTSVIPLTVCKDSAGNPEQFLYGIFKATIEMIHTVIEAMRYLATDFLGASDPNSVKIFTTGHSLGGAMCSNFTYLWMGIKKTSPYNTAPYNVLADNIVCVSLGSPRCMSSSVAKKFCNFVAQKKILYLRMTTNGDPVPALPPKTGFQHPCSEDHKMREIISEACAPQLTMRPTPDINYNGNLDCLNYKGRIYIANVLSHTVYLDILYIKAVDLPKFFAGMVSQQEVLRTTDGSTVCRLIIGQNSKKANYKAVFFNVNRSRSKPDNIDLLQEGELEKVDPNASAQLSATEATAVAAAGEGFDFSMPKFTTPNVNMPKFGGPVAEDIRMTLQAFNQLIQEMVPLQGELCPLKGKMVNPFNNQTMPDLSCPGLKFGGKRRHTKRRKHYSKKSKSLKRKY
jgi:hypothetical protein